MQKLSIISPIGYSNSSCGYCTTPDGDGNKVRSEGSRSFGCWAHTMTAVTYCDLIKLGWRRSGSYLYKPDNRATCCPQLTISLNSKLFSPSKHQRQIINKFNKFVTEGAGTKEGTAGWGPVRADGTDEIGVNETVKAPPEKAKKGERKANTPIDLSEMLHAAESDHDIDYTFKHDFKLELEPSSFTTEKFALYSKYQTIIHNDPPSKMTTKGFNSFLVDSPISLEPIPGSPGKSYGSYHGLYRLDGKLIAFSVVDILPGALSSVYFVWDPDFSSLSLGKLSALREISMAREWNLDRYMMGFYIMDCVKMKYKGEYQPSELLDPETNEFYPFADCAARLRINPHASFSAPLASILPPQLPAPPIVNPATSTLPLKLTSAAKKKQKKEKARAVMIDGPTWPSILPPSYLDPEDLPDSLIEEATAVILEEGKAVIYEYKTSPIATDPIQSRKVRECIAALGLKMEVASQSQETFSYSSVSSAGKPYLCNIEGCEKVFTWLGNLNRHKLMNGERVRLGEEIGGYPVWSHQRDPTTVKDRHKFELGS